MATVTKTLSLRAMLKNLKEQRGLSFEEIGALADVEDVKKGNAVWAAAATNKNISFRLADWVLNEFYGNADPLEAAMRNLALAGLPVEQIQTIKQTIAGFKGQPPPAPLRADGRKRSKPPQLTRQELDFLRGFLRADMARSQRFATPQHLNVKTIARKLDRLAALQASAPHPGKSAGTPGSAATNAAPNGSP